MSTVYTVQTGPNLTPKRTGKADWGLAVGLLPVHFQKIASALDPL